MGFMIKEVSNMEYELVIVWNDGTKDVYYYASRAEAEEIADGFLKAFGVQVWTCINEKRGGSYV